MSTSTSPEQAHVRVQHIPEIEATFLHVENVEPPDEYPAYQVLTEQILDYRTRLMLIGPMRLEPDGDITYRYEGSESVAAEITFPGTPAEEVVQAVAIDLVLVMRRAGLLVDGSEQPPPLT